MMQILQIVNEVAVKPDEQTGIESDFPGIQWVHLEGQMEEARSWLETHLSVDLDTINALCDELTRPRLFVNAKDDLVLTLRTVQPNTEHHPLVSIRALVTDGLLLTLSYVETPAVQTLTHTILRKSKGIKTPYHLLEKLCELVVDQMTAHVNDLDESLSDLEDVWEEAHALDADRLQSVRLETSRVRRYLVPQMDALIRFSQILEQRLLNKKEKRSLLPVWRDLNNAVKRDVEAINEIKERLAILRDALDQRTNQESNRIMFLLSMVATFFLPLTFIASLLGMNVGGIPFQNHPYAFAGVCLLMVVLGALQWVFFKKWHWLK